MYNTVVCVSAPEVASMHPYGHASDWWSLGVLMFALLVGQVYRSSHFSNRYFVILFSIIRIIIVIVIVIAIAISKLVNVDL